MQKNKKMIKKFKNPIYVSGPIFPDLNKYVDRLKEVWDSGFITNSGKQVEKLEKKLSKVLDVPEMSLSSSGTSALFNSIRYCKLSGEVITTPFTFASTIHSLTANGITPVFCDIDYETMNIDPERIIQLITPKTTGILGVHIFGVPCEVNRIKEIADKYGLKVVYDAAHAFGLKYDRIGIGNYGDASIFSFHATKLFHTAEGGGIVCKNKAMKKNVDIMRNFGIKANEKVVGPELNGKMSEIHAALGLEVLRYIEDEKRKRRKILNIYDRRLKNIKGIIFNTELKKYNLQYFVIKIDKKLFGKSRDEVNGLFKAYNVYTRKYFYPLCSNYPHYKNNISSERSKLAVANRVSKEVLALPFHGNLSEEDANSICDILISFSK